MNLYEKLKHNDLVVNEKDYSELIYNRQIKVNNQIVDNPKHKIDSTKKNIIKIGILQREI